jgi:hypothetical protein
MSDQRRGTITLGREDGDTVTKPILSSGERIPVMGSAQPGSGSEWVYRRKTLPCANRYCRSSRP